MSDPTPLTPQQMYGGVPEQQQAPSASPQANDSTQGFTPAGDQPTMPNPQASPQAVAHATPGTVPAPMRDPPRIPAAQDPQALPTGAPGQAPASSEQNAIKLKPQIDPRPYAWMAENDPTRRAAVDAAAERAGISPVQLAAHFNAESGGRFNVPDGAAGEVGGMQIMPATAKLAMQKAGLPPGSLDLRNPQDNLFLGALVLRQLNDRFGNMSPSVALAYQGGPGTADAIARNPAEAANHPVGMQYLQKIYGGQDPTQIIPGVTASHGMTPQGIIASGSQGGPQGLLKYIAQTKSPGAPMTDAWRQADATLAGLMASRGDIAGMQHAHDYITQMAHVGTNQFLMQAHQSMGAGDPVGAANALAKAHAFFPDESAGQFSVDEKGQLWGSRNDENTGKPIGSPFQITQQGIEQQLTQTSDPNKFVAMMQEQQKNNANIRHTDAMGNYYGNLLQSRQDIAAQNNQAKEDIAERRSAATENAATIRAGARQGMGNAPGVTSLARAADKEADTLYGNLGTARGTMSDVDAGQTAAIYHDARMNGVSPPEAKAVASGLATGQLKLARLQDGTYAAVDPKSKTPVPIAYLSKGMGDRLAGTQAGQALPTGAPRPGAQSSAQPQSRTPVGAGGASSYAQGAGISQNLTGTVMPSPPTSALPVAATQ